MVEGTGLENRHTGEPGIESSNLSLSVPIRSVRVGFVATGPRLVPSREYRFFVCGWVAEWLKAHAWKVCLGQKPNVGSNPTPSVDLTYT